MGTRLTLTVVVMSLLATANARAQVKAGEAPKRAFEVAEPFDLPDGAPQPGDVVMRSLRKRPANDGDPYDTIDALKAFHASQLVWA